MSGKIKTLWRMVRRLSGDDAYEQYLKHCVQYHQDDTEHADHPPLSKAEFFKQWQDTKWNSIKRCC